MQYASIKDRAMRIIKMDRAEIAHTKHVSTATTQTAVDEIICHIQEENNHEEKQH